MFDNDDLQELLQEYQRQRESISEFQRELQEIKATAVAPRQVVKVTVGAQGELVEISFPTGAYKNLPPKEFAEILVTTVDEARQKVLASVVEIMTPRLPDGADATAWLRGDPGSLEGLPDEPVIPEEVQSYLDHGLPQNPDRRP
ncbi:YbaB/EbfC family nucleoid-associated protein [Amycolatopsis japonica]